MKALNLIVNTVLIIAIGGIAVLSLATMLPIPGRVEVKIVQSGSMEPTIHTGAIVVIHPEPSYAVGDVVTFGADTKTEVPTTHRIIAARSENGVTLFTTKGDANEDADTAETPSTDVIGRVLFSVPYVGYLLDFARKPLGFVLLIVVPAALIILHELWGIVEEIRRRKKKKDDDTPAGGTPVEMQEVANGTEKRVIYTRNSVMEDIYRPEVVTMSRRMRNNPVFFAALIASCAVGAIGTTVASYSDVEKSIDNLLSATMLDFGADADAPRVIALTVEGEGVENAVGFQPFVVEIEGSLPFAYMIEAEVMGGDTAFCESLQLHGSAPLFDYDGALYELSTATTTDVSPWSLDLYLLPDSGIADGTLCTVDLVYKGAQEGGEVDEQYHDEERIPLLVTYKAPPAPVPFMAPEGEVLGEETENTEEPLVEIAPPTKELENATGLVEDVGA